MACRCPRSSSPTAGAPCCSASAHSGRRRRRASLFAMAEPCSRPRLPPRRRTRMTEAVQRLIPTVRLDRIEQRRFSRRTDNDFQLLEVNPRPGATLDIFEPTRARSSRCISPPARACCRRSGRYSRRRGHRPSFTRHAISRRFRARWPAWTADRPGVGTAVKRGDPLCTVLASAADAADARALVEQRIKLVHARTTASIA